ncbi:hypothetical protein AVEN_14400-1 [Araneus ventricosus]|uniref:Uncharacterized protein n=1 Tax=Araneus ventricosus TaxID=182803 RepID=A0A4Y2BCP9_ARAVE|nr:hypothetical protein AVEN_14400-1 [Araneus ventricosus]
MNAMMQKTHQRPRWPSDKVSDSQPDGFQVRNTISLKIRRVLSLLNVKSYVMANVLPLVWRGSLERGFQLRCCPRHLTVVQNYEVRPKRDLVLLQNETLI